VWTEIIKHDLTSLDRQRLKRTWLRSKKAGGAMMPPAVVLVLAGFCQRLFVVGGCEHEHVIQVPFAITDRLILGDFERIPVQVDQHQCTQLCERLCPGIQAVA